MNYDEWKTTPPDDDPDGDQFALQQEQDGRCPSCGARDDEDCEPDCLCAVCEQRRASEGVA